MYVTNMEEQDTSKLYRCNGVIANWLTYTKKIPLYGKGKNGEWYFAKTEKLKEALDEMPFYYRILGDI